MTRSGRPVLLKEIQMQILRRFPVRAAAEPRRERGAPIRGCDQLP